MDSFNPQIPGSMLKALEGSLGLFEYHRLETTVSNASVFRLETLKKKQSFYLKIAAKTDRLNSIEVERKAYYWLSGKMPIPTVRHFQRVKKWVCICTQALPGRTLAESLDTLPPETVVKIYAQTLKQLHKLPTDDCPLRFSLGERIALARERVELGEVDDSDFEAENQRYTSEVLFEKMLQLVPHEQYLVFTHGDYCMDNIMVKNGELCGLIDLCRAGIADRYQDIALAMRSIRHELGAGYESLFCQEYGLDRLDQDKVDFYVLLDEFF
jgi:aminoglycoside phosphotransferase